MTIIYALAVVWSSADWKEHLATERYCYDGPMAAATPFATDARCTVSKHSVEIIAGGSLRFGQKSMNQERPTQCGCQVETRIEFFNEVEITFLSQTRRRLAAI